MATRYVLRDQFSGEAYTSQDEKPSDFEQPVDMDMTIAWWSKETYTPKEEKSVPHE